MRGKLRRATPAGSERQASLTMGEKISDTEEWIRELAEQHSEFADRLAERESPMIPAEDPDYENLGPGFPAVLGGSSRQRSYQPF
jgi:hypothetical protein